MNMNKRLVAVSFFLLSQSLCLAKPAFQKSNISEQLKKDGILITPKTYKQIFQAYIKDPRNRKSKKCVFITSDSLLNAYHVLFEESMRILEEKQAENLKRLVNALYNRLPKRKELYKNSAPVRENYFSRARLILGVAIKLFQPAFKLKHLHLDKLADLEIAKINKAQGCSMPEWLGSPSPKFLGVDYNKFKVRSFYCKSENLKRYFKATKWLQTIPFKINNDTDLFTYDLILCAWRDLINDYSRKEKYSRYFEIYDKFLGKPSGLGIYNFNNIDDDYKNSKDYDDGAKEQSYIEQFRSNILRKAQKVFINDKIHLVQTPNYKIADIRIIPARQTPSAILFSFTSDYSKSKQYVPQGLEIAAMLGSKLAMHKLKPEVQTVIQKYNRFFNPKADNLYGMYLLTLKNLFEPPNKLLPYFMKNKSWEIKSCNTVLGGWAQLRHTWGSTCKK